MPVIGIEGLDGAGKTTLARRLELPLGALLVNLITSKRSQETRAVVNGGDDIEARYDFFRRFNKFELVCARGYGSAHRATLLQSTFYRTLVTHRVLGSRDAAEAEATPGTVPDLTIYLDVDLAERARRLTKRDGGIKYSSHWDKMLQEREEALVAEYRGLHLPTIDANQGIEAVASDALGNSRSN
jgi:thymidylate kinase